MRGSCHCGGVEFEVSGPLRPAIPCHCTQCRKWSGHYWAASSVPLAGFQLTKAATLRWYRASDVAERGFCERCSASLFWKPLAEDRISFAAGALDGPSGLCRAEDWFSADAGDYYTDAPVHAEVLHGSCLCGANLFTLPGPMGEVWGCHCTQCRKASGHFSASFEADPAAIVWEARHLRDYAYPNGGLRHFCPTCGSGVTYVKGAVFSVEAGVIDNPTGGHLVRHYFAADKGDYYDLDDGLPQV